MTHYGRYDDSERRQLVGMHSFGVARKGWLWTAVGPCMAVSVRDPVSKFTVLGHFLDPLAEGSLSKEAYEGFVGAIKHNILVPELAVASVNGASPEGREKKRGEVVLARESIVQALRDLGIRQIEERYLEHAATLAYDIKADTGEEIIEEHA